MDTQWSPRRTHNPEVYWVRFPKAALYMLGVGAYHACACYPSDVGKLEIGFSCELMVFSEQYLEQLN